MDFYLRHIAGARDANIPENFKEDLLALLHWKDGKAIVFVPGEEHAKLNTLGKPSGTLFAILLSHLIGV